MLTEQQKDKIAYGCAVAIMLSGLISAFNSQMWSLALLCSVIWITFFLVTVVIGISDDQRWKYAWYVVMYLAATTLIIRSYAGFNDPRELGTAFIVVGVTVELLTTQITSALQRVTG